MPHCATRILNPQKWLLFWVPKNTKTKKYKMHIRCIHHAFRLFLWLSNWWFHVFFIFTPTWGNDPIWLICFRWVETTNKFSFVDKYTIVPWIRPWETQLNCLNQVIQSALSSPSWRSLNLSKRSLNHPEKVTLNHQELFVFSQWSVRCRVWWLDWRWQGESFFWAWLHCGVYS